MDSLKRVDFQRSKQFSESISDEISDKTKSGAQTSIIFFDSSFLTQGRYIQEGLIKLYDWTSGQPFNHKNTKNVRIW